MTHKVRRMKPGQASFSPFHTVSVFDPALAFSASAGQKVLEKMVLWGCKHCGEMAKPLDGEVGRYSMVSRELYRVPSDLSFLYDATEL